MILATRVLKVRYSFSTTPLRMVFISGMPEPGGAASRSPSVVGICRTHVGAGLYRKQHSLFML